MTSDRKVGLALGGGAARGIAHIVALEAFDELGVKPAVVAGTSIGALIGACYCAGMSGKDIRDHAISLFEARTELVRLVWKNRAASAGRLLNFRTSSVINAEALFQIVLPDHLPSTFEDLVIPFKVVTTDFYAQEEVVLTTGNLIAAISASSALPALLKPVQHEGRILIDGGFVNPTPFDLLKPEVDVTVAVDVTGKIKRGEVRQPTSTEALIGSTHIMLRALINEKLKNQAPDLFIRPEVSEFGILDFYKIEEILAASGKVKDEIKRDLEPLLT